MNIKLYQTPIGAIRIDAIFPPQKRTVHLAQLDKKHNVIKEGIFFLEFPKLVFGLIYGLPPNTMFFDQENLYFRLVAFNEKNEELKLMLPNVFNKGICLGYTLKIKRSEMLKFQQNLNINAAKDMIIPFIDDFWNSKFTALGELESIIYRFNESKTKINPINITNKDICDVYDWTLLTEETNEY